jgi:hypothetical protein
MLREVLPMLKSKRQLTKVLIRIHRMVAILVLVVDVTAGKINNIIFHKNYNMFLWKIFLVKRKEVKIK